ncbi:BgTH12-04695 [Blumeria graminis f. sp. triticale]|uniref:NEDD8-activating enzyme E1 regulatory subunit n=3 Tax=Blumeria graminis TaxID=34373 RepID=A0A061HB09_BLUGR|nr:hypothetical protein BGT96224_2290 [Blumeria graminis f. sp. tritici 96224]CAD6499041.1 BgTH12-04695 [Blumeria graminis f. sp. triticale]VCU39179.1 Bgt-2290 [Blumeria graminis f. sp. tritici]
MDHQNCQTASVPIAKEQKYDRQLRLWAAHGQQALEEAEILLINTGSGTVGVETLKNLVLPGVGKFTIIDDAKVCDADLGVNFFLDKNSLGSYRAECCVRHLQELNPEVKGDFHSVLDVRSFKSYLENRSFSFVLHTFPIRPDLLAIVEKHVASYKIPLISIHSVGFYSYFKIKLPTVLPIVDTHPEFEATTDLRLLNPWKELSEYSASLTKEIKTLSAHEHGHIPYVALLLHFLDEWKKIHGTVPLKYAEKKAFKEFVAAGAREVGEENFEEAIAAIMKTIKSPSLSSSIREVFEHLPQDPESNLSFWIIADAIKQFYARHKVLPLPGSLPDMKAESTVYVKLQNIYKAKSRQDVAEVLELIQNHPSYKIVSKTDVEDFCKNAAFVKLIHPSDDTKLDIKAIVEKELINDDPSLDLQPPSLLPIYLALKATSHVSAASSTDILAIIEENTPKAAALKRVRSISEEVARARGGELHNISAFTGGMVAQEVIKIITRQYIPIDNTCIFDGITSRIQVINL